MRATLDRYLPGCNAMLGNESYVIRNEIKTLSNTLSHGHKSY